MTALAQYEYKHFVVSSDSTSKHFSSVLQQYLIVLISNECVAALCGYTIQYLHVLIRTNICHIRVGAARALPM